MKYSSLTFISEPSGSPADTNPVSLADAKAVLRVSGTSEDSTIQGYIDAAIAHLDGKDGTLGRALMTQTWDVTFNDFPSGSGSIVLPLPPLQSVTSVKYFDASNVEQTVSSSDYRVLTRTPGEIEPVDGWPSVYDRKDAVTVRFVAGYGSAATDVPQPIRTAINMLVAQWYDNRTPINVGQSVSRLPNTVEALVAPFRVYAF